MECAKIRAERCPLFAEKNVNTVEAQSRRLPETGVPPGIFRGAVEMETLQYFAPNLSGPATTQTPFAADDDDEEAADAEKNLDEAEVKQDNDAPETCRAPDALIAEENANAEFLIGLDGSPDDDAIGKLAAFGAKVEKRRALVYPRETLLRSPN